MIFKATSSGPNATAFKAVGVKVTTVSSKGLQSAMLNLNTNQLWPLNRVDIFSTSVLSPVSAGRHAGICDGACMTLILV